MNVESSTGKASPICFYGDDFTGATAHLAGFHDAGLRALMFLNTPTASEIEKNLNSLDVLGVAGIGRSLSPQHMAKELLPAFQLFRSLGAQNIHYKVCSTFDSSPSVGSIGKAIELALETFGRCHIPIVISCPGFGRYVVFGNLFARYGSEVVRIDRHPTMAFHPATPMNEADMRRHLAQQTSLTSHLVDLRILQGTDEALNEAWEDTISEDPAVVFFDTQTESDLDRIASFLWNKSQLSPTPVFTVASQGLAQATGRYLARTGATKKDERDIAPVDLSQMLVLSGSASPQNALQIKTALEAGWHGIRIDMERALSPESASSVVAEIKQEIESCLRTGKSVVVYTAMGPSDPAIEAANKRSKERQLSQDTISFEIGGMFAQWMTHAVENCGLQRVILAGGDTSSHTMRKIDAYALRIAANGVDGGRLCRLVSDNPAFDCLEVMLKGGQVGGPGVFVNAANASAWRT